MSPLINDTDEDLRIRPRRSVSEERNVADRRSVEMDEPLPADREVTLSTGTVLALFFTLALVCAVFFGFGYSMGKKSGQAASATETASVRTSSTEDDSGEGKSAPGTTPVSAAKPAPGSPAAQPVPAYVSQSEAGAASREPAVSVAKPTTPAASTYPAATPVVRKPVDPTTTATVAPARPVPVTVARTAPPTATTPAPVVPTTAGVPGMTYVQIAAVSHQEDADVLSAALRRRGYKVVARNDLGDRLIHVQIGPFSDRKEAEATRQKLLSDGYNAFLK